MLELDRISREKSKTNSSPFGTVLLAGELLSHSPSQTTSSGAGGNQVSIGHKHHTVYVKGKGKYEGHHSKNFHSGQISHQGRMSTPPQAQTIVFSPWANLWAQPVYCPPCSFPSQSQGRAPSTVQQQPGVLGRALPLVVISPLSCLPFSMHYLFNLRILIGVWIQGLLHTS